MVRRRSLRQTHTGRAQRPRMGPQRVGGPWTDPSPRMLVELRLAGVGGETV